MFKVKSSKILRLLALRSMKKNIWRNAVAIIAIALTSILFTSIFSIGGGFLDQAKQSDWRLRGGDSMVGVKFLSEPEYKTLQNAATEAKISYTRLVGRALDEALKKINVEVRYGEDAAAKNLFSLPSTGRMPQSENEISASTSVLDALGVPYEIGATFHFSVEVVGEKGASQTHRDSFVLCGYWEADKVAPAQQVWVSLAYANKIVPAAQNSYNSSGNYSGLYMAEIDFDSRFNLEQKLQNLLASAGLLDAVYSVDSSVLPTGAVDWQTVLSAVFFVGIIMLSGYLIIYNIFYISVTQDIQFYGLLKTIGTSGRQIKKIVRSQALFLSGIGIPIGLIIGYFVGLALLPNIMKTLSTFEPNGNYTVSPWMMIFAALFSLATVYISCMKPSYAASKVSPVEASKFTYGINLKKSKKAKKAQEKATPFGMAKANILKTRSKFILVTLSLTLSLTLLTITYTAITGFDLDKFIDENMIGDFRITHYSINSHGFGMDKVTDGITPDFENEAHAQAGLEDYHAVRINQSKQPMDKPQWEALMRHYRAEESENNRMVENMEMYEKNDSFNYFTYGLDEASALLVDMKSGDFDAKKWASGKYVIVGGYLPISGENLELYQQGDTITLYDKEGNLHSYTVMGIGELRNDLTIQMTTSDTVYVYLPENERAQLFGQANPMTVYFNVADEKRDVVEAWLRDYCSTEGEDLVYISRTTYEAEFERDKITFSLIGGALSLVLGLIGILNFAGTIIASITARRKELAMLSAVGMSGIQIKAMLMWESAWYIVFSVLLTTTLGSALSWVLGESLLSVFWAFSWRFTLVPLLTVLPFLILVAASIPLAYYKNVCKQSVVARLQTE